MESPAVSVIIPACRSERWIARAIRSVLGQPGVTREVIVVEDGVFDNTRRLVESFDGVRLITLRENRGAPFTRNTGLAEARAELVMFLDADDYIEGPLLLGLSRALRDSGADVGFGPWRMAWENKRDSKVIIPKNLSPVDRVATWLVGGYQPPCSVLWRRSSLLRRQGWRVGLRKNQDGEVTIRCLLDGCNSTVSREGAGVYWQHASADRVSSLSMLEALPSQDILRTLVETWLVAHPSEASTLRQSLAMFCYVNAKGAFYAGDAVQGKAWLAHARQHGLRRHRGTMGHIVFAALLGLSGKERLSAWLHARSKNR